MLGIHPAGRDFHHAYVRNNCSGDEGPFFQSLEDASDVNFGSNCYILSSTIDSTWFIVRGKSPSGYREDELDDWFRDVTVKGRIDKVNA